MVTLRSAFADAGPGLVDVAGVVVVADCAKAPANATRVMAVVRINFFMILFSNFLFLFISSGRLSFSPCLLIQMYGSPQARFVVMNETCCSIRMRGCSKGTTAGTLSGTICDPGIGYSGTVGL